MKDESIDITAEALRQRQSGLFRERQVLQKRRDELLCELRDIEGNMETITRRVDAIRHVLMRELPALRHGERIDWQTFTVPEAACRVLQSEGVFLTESQLRTGIEEHGLLVDDTNELGERLRESMGEGIPLLEIRAGLWAHRDWLEEARFSDPERLRKPAE